MRKQYVLQITWFYLIKPLQKGTSPAGVFIYVWIQPLQQQRSQSGLRVPAPELADLCFLKNIVATKNLIGTFTSQHNFEIVIPDQSRKQV